MRFFWRLLIGMALVVAATALVADRRVTHVVESSRLEMVREQVRDEAWLVAEVVRAAYLSGETARLVDLALAVSEQLEGLRVTVIAADGAVVADSHGEPEGMESHAERPELLEPGVITQRYSTTLEREMIYLALPVRDDDGALVAFARVALDLSDVTRAGGLLRQALVTATLVALGVGLVLALIISSRISKPLERIARAIGGLGRGEYGLRVEEGGSAEIRSVARAVNDVGRRLLEREGLIVAEAGQKAAILSAMEEGLVAVDREQRVVLLNEAGKRLLDVGDNGVGERLADLTDLPELLLSAEGCLEGGERSEGEIGDADSDMIQYTATPVRVAGGQAEMAVLVLRDVTAIRRLEQVRRDFVANVSHELKTPLTTMRGYLEAVLDDPDMDPKLRRSFLKKAGRSTARLTSIVSDLLDLARLERGPDEMAFEQLDASALVVDCVRNVENDAEEREVVIEVASTAPGSMIRGDDQSLVTAVTNLLDNAIKYTPAGGRVTVRVSREGRKVWIRVSDEGPGIPAHEQERIFERFYRIDKDRSRQLGGTGLGLSIVRNVVSAHGGEVWVESVVGEGSTFHMRLPLDPHSVSRAPKPPSSKPVAPDAGPGST